MLKLNQQHKLSKKKSSKLKFEQVNTKELGRYVATTVPRSKIKQEKLEEVIPTRTSNKGKAPGITSRSCQSPNDCKEDKSWDFCKVREPSLDERRSLMRLAVEAAILASFTNSLYSFNGKVYIQNTGGPTG